MNIRNYVVGVCIVVVLAFATVISHAEELTIDPAIKPPEPTLPITPAVPG